MKKFLVAGGLVVAAITAAAQDQRMADLARTFKVSGPTSFADGKVRGATAGVTDLKANQTIELFQTAGRSLCESSSATRSMPSDAGYGWRLRITPISAADGLTMDVEWQRILDRGAAITNGPRGKSRISLHAGDKIMLDYVPAQATGGGCDALGMGLQLELGATESQALAEADLWLIRSRDNQTVERQIVRARQGSWTEFFFKDIAQTFTNFFFFNDPRGRGEPLPPLERTVRASGRIQIDDVKPDRITATVDLRMLVVGAPNSARGSAMFEVSGGQTDVIDVKVPRIPDDQGRVGEALSLRVQLRPIGR
jgi:hypothetical protein